MVRLPVFIASFFQIASDIASQIASDICNDGVRQRQVVELRSCRAHSSPGLVVRAERFSTSCGNEVAVHLHRSDDRADVLAIDGLRGDHLEAHYDYFSVHLGSSTSDLGSAVVLIHVDGPVLAAHREVAP